MTDGTNDKPSAPKEFARVTGPFGAEYQLLVADHLVHSAYGEANRKLFQRKADAINAAIQSRIAEEKRKAVEEFREPTPSATCQSNQRISGNEN